jgi:hypothetical protein
MISVVSRTVTVAGRWEGGSDAGRYERRSRLCWVLMNLRMNAEPLEVNLYAICCDMIPSGNAWSRALGMGGCRSRRHRGFR